MEMENLILTAHDVGAMNLEKGMKINSALFFDKPRQNDVNTHYGKGIEKYNSAVIVAPGSQRWESTKAFDELWNGQNGIMAKMNSLKNAYDYQTKQIKVNAAQFSSDYYDLINMFRLDLSRRRVEAGDYTPIMAQEIVNANISRTAAVDEFLPYVGAFEEFTGRGPGESVVMMEHTTGSTSTITQKMYALGDARTLEDELYNLDIFSTMKVMDAYVRAHTAKRNDLVMNPMLSASYDGLQTVAADSTGDTLDVKTYNTLNNMIEAIRKLNDPQTGLPIDASRITIACAWGDERRINRVINGQLDNSKGKSQNLQALNEVVNIIPYRGDIITVGKRKYTYSGIPLNTVYMFVSGANNAPNYVVTKRGLTYETVSGQPFDLIRNGQVAYFSQAEYNKEFLGQAGGYATGTGYVVKGTLPTS